jgi:hypothetical protein
MAAAIAAGSPLRRAIASRPAARRSRSSRDAPSVRPSSSSSRASFRSTIRSSRPARGALSQATELLHHRVEVLGHLLGELDVGSAAVADRAVRVLDPSQVAIRVLKASLPPIGLLEASEDPLEEIVGGRLVV